MQISRTLHSGRQLGLWPERKPTDGQWVTDGIHNDDTVELLQRTADTGYFHGSSSKATFFFKDNTTTKKLTPAERKSLKKQTLEMGLLGAVGGAIAGAGLALFSVAYAGGNYGATEKLIAKIAAGLGAGVGALALTDSPRKLLQQPEGTPVEKVISGRLSRSGDGNEDLLFQPDGSSEKVNLNTFQHAQKAPKGEDGQFEFGQQWWNRPGLARPRDSGLKSDGSLS